MRATTSGRARGRRLLTAIACVLVIGLSATSGTAAKDDESVDVLRRTGRAFSAVAKKSVDGVVSIQVEKLMGGDASGRVSR